MIETETWLDLSAPADMPGGKPAGIAADGAPVDRLVLAAAGWMTEPSPLDDGADGGDEGG